MIRITIEVKDKSVAYRFEDEATTLTEVALVNLKLDEAKDYLKAFEFESEFEVKEGYEEEEEN